jgi:hypothetical protein
VLAAVCIFADLQNNQLLVSIQIEDKQTCTQSLKSGSLSPKEACAALVSRQKTAATCHADCLGILIIVLACSLDLFPDESVSIAARRPLPINPFWAQLARLQKTGT